jgi:hypothetical protein
LSCGRRHPRSCAQMRHNVTHLAEDRLRQSSFDCFGIRELCVIPRFVVVNMLLLFEVYPPSRHCVSPSYQDGQLSSKQVVVGSRPELGQSINQLVVKTFPAHSPTSLFPDEPSNHSYAPSAGRPLGLLALMEVLLRTPLTRQDWLLGRSDRSKSNNPGTACGLCQRI